MWETRALTMRKMCLGVDLNHPKEKSEGVCELRTCVDVSNETRECTTNVADPNQGLRHGSVWCVHLCRVEFSTNRPAKMDAPI